MDLNCQTPDTTVPHVPAEASRGQPPSLTGTSRQAASGYDEAAQVCSKAVDLKHGLLVSFIILLQRLTERDERAAEKETDWGEERSGCHQISFHPSSDLHKYKHKSQGELGIL